MIQGTPKWLAELERRFGRFAIPQLQWVIVGFPVFGFIVLYLNPAGLAKMVLSPELVLKGEYWRVITFLAVPSGESGNLFFFIIYVWFLYFVASALVSEWGEFKTTLYFVIAWLLSVIFSFVASYPLYGMTDIGLSMLLALAVMHPDFEILLFLVLPTKLKWVALITVAWVAYKFFKADTDFKIYLLLVYANYLLFFGPYHIDQFRQMQRRRKFRNQWK